MAFPKNAVLALTRQVRPLRPSLSKMPYKAKTAFLAMRVLTALLAFKGQNGFFQKNAVLALTGQ